MTASKRDNIFNDLIVLDNQIPFESMEVIWNVLKIKNIVKQDSFLIDVISDYFYSLFPGKKHNHTECNLPIIHILHLCHHNICNHHSNPENKEKCIHGSFSGDWKPDGHRIPCAAELDKVGMKFKRKEDCESFLDITFENGVLKIPNIAMSDHGRIMFHNLQKFEDLFNEKTEISSQVKAYIMLMCFLIKTSDDAKILSQAGILNDRIGVLENDIPKFFNELSTIKTNGTNYYQHELSKDINKYYKTWYNLWIAILKRNYRNNPWFIVSSIVATILLFSAIDMIIRNIG